MTSPDEPVAEPFFEPLPPSPAAEDRPPVYVQMPWQPPVNVRCTTPPEGAEHAWFGYAG